MTPHNKCSRQKRGKMDHQEEIFLFQLLLSCEKWMPVGGKQFYPTVCRARPTIDIRHPDKDMANKGQKQSDSMKYGASWAKKTRIFFFFFIFGK